MQCIDVLSTVAGKVAKAEQKDLIARVFGQFYTHPLIGNQLIEATYAVSIAMETSSVRIVDPFCGDGRLVCWLLEKISSSSVQLSYHLEIELWDIDKTALQKAVCTVIEISSRLNLKVNVQARDTNTFQYAFSRFGQFDIVVTNPPWEVLKPDRRDMGSLQPKDREAYIDWLKKQDKLLTELYPRSQPQKKFSGWGTNLARCGTEVALRLIAPGGVCGIVSPASLLADQLTEELRRWIFENYTIHQLAYYPAEARLFPNVDQASITMVVTQGRGAQRSQ